MRVTVQLTGLHPRSEDLIELTRSYDRGRASWTEIQDCLTKDTLQLEQLEKDLGFEFLSDGALGWQDPLRPLAKSLKGIELGTGYSRWFDTNTFYLKPHITNGISPADVRIEDFLQATFQPGKHKWKISLPGPYTFSQLSDNKHYQNKSDLTLDIAEAEREVAGSLFKLGVSLIQLSEPCLVYRPYREDPLLEKELDLAIDAVGRVADGETQKFSVQTFFGDASPVSQKLLQLPVSAVGIDLYETDFSSLDWQTSKSIVLGIVDSEESSLENPGDIVETALKTVKRIVSPQLILAPNSDLKFLPRSVADKKLSVLAEAARILEETV